MTSIKTRAIRLGLSALHRSGAAATIAPRLQGVGAIFMLHHVRPQTSRGFSPNSLLEITPEFLDTACTEVRRAGFDIVDLDEAHARLTGGQRSPRPFACFTFDDGYRDNRDHAFPILKRHGVPFTVYVASDFADGRGFLWWLVLEEVIRRAGSISIQIDGRTTTYPCDTDAARARTWSAVYWQLRNRPESEARAIVAGLAEAYGFDPIAPCRELAMTWQEIAQLACDPLVTIGAHTVSHMALGQLPASDARAEMAGSIRRIELEIGRRCRHFCYPYGDAVSAGEREFDAAAQLGQATGVTTRKGFVTAAHANRCTALPRVSLNGNFQSLSCLRALLSGVPFALWNSIEPILAQRRKPRVAAAYGAEGGSGRSIHLTSQAAGTTHANPPTT